MKLFYSDDYVAAGHSFDTTRKSQWIADSLQKAPIRGEELLAPEQLTRDELVRVHSRKYVDAVASGEPRGSATSQGFDWDAGLWKAVCASNGGAVAAALAALKDGVAGSLSSGMHHARRDRGQGFCTFNGLVLAADAALQRGARRVLILDLDAHCGGGTYELVLGDSRIEHRDVSVSSFDSYPTDRGWQQLQLVTRAGDYLPAVETALESVPKGIDLVVYNAGQDPYEGCSIGGLRGITAEMLGLREARVFDWARRRKLPIAFVLAGGYTGTSLDRAQLVELHRLTISAAAGLHVMTAVAGSIGSVGLLAPGAGAS